MTAAKKAGRTKAAKKAGGTKAATKAGRPKAAKKASGTKAAKKAGPTKAAKRPGRKAARPEGAARPAPRPAVRKALSEYRRKRDFSRTAEPSGDDSSGSPSSPASATRPLAFVIQKHAASHLHFDFRLELDGVMKSWAVPKGPSLDTTVRRLAMEVEDHPMSYNSFEGTIPKGQYGGGTVMLWDRGHYLPSDGKIESLRKGMKKGRLDIVMLGERLKGGFTLVRSNRDTDKPQWLLFKRTDEFADPGRDIVEEEVTSVESGRTMEEIARAPDAVWHSNRK